MVPPFHRRKPPQAKAIRREEHTEAFPWDAVPLALAIWLGLLVTVESLLQLPAMPSQSVDQVLQMSAGSMF